MRSSPYPRSEAIDFDEPFRYRLMRFGLPFGLAFFAIAVISLVNVFDLVLAAVLAPFVLLIAQSIAMNLLAAHRIRVADAGLEAWTLLGRIVIAWSSLESLELVDRKGVAVPRRLLRIAARSRPGQLFLMDSMARFDELLAAILHRTTNVRVAGMPLWRRLLLLQWGT